MTKEYELLKASCVGDLEAVKRFTAKNIFKKGVSVGIMDKYERTPLHYAACCGHLKIVKLLLRRRADVDFKDYIGKTPLHGAAEGGCFQIIELLIKHGADVNIKSNDGQTPLFSVIKECKAKSPIVLLLRNIDHGTDVSAKIVELFIKHGTDVDIKDDKGFTALDYAKKYNLEKIIKLLENKNNE